MKKLLLIALFGVLAFFTSCRKDKLITDAKAKLTFSQDSILYDTVFTQIGSTTKLFTVHNKNSGNINISSIHLARGNSSFFRLNVDGQPGKSFTDVEIAAHDSIYVFVEVTIDPSYDPSVSPFIYQDSIIFETNGNTQDVDLIAFGQNAYYHMPDHKIIFSNTQAFYYSLDTNTNTPNSIPTCITWKTDKPHLIYGYLVVDSLHQLTIQAGAKIYMHNSAGLWVYRGGCIKILGAHGSEVVFQGDRLEAEYKDVPGQWDRIWISEGSSGNCGGTRNVIDYAIIKNAFIGVHAGYSVLDGYGGSTINVNDPKQLSLSNTIIQNCSYAGLLAHYYNITGGNNLIDNCGKYILDLEYGGNYSFKECTFANYWNQTNNSGTAQTRTTPSFKFNNYIGATVLPYDSLFFGNCIMDGNLTEEFQFDTIAQPGWITKMIFDHTIMRTQKTFTGAQAFPFFSATSWPANFVNPGAYDFHLGSLSAAGGVGNTLYSSQWFLDLEGNARANDLGAYKK